MRHDFPPFQRTPVMQLTCRIDQMLDHTGDYCTKLIAARVTLCLYFVTEQDLVVSFIGGHSRAVQVF